MKWLNNIIERDLEIIRQEKNLPGWFSSAAISNIPYISFPGLSDQECIEIHEQSMNVMRNSRSLNHYKEVAATFCLDKKGEVFFTYGDQNKILLFDDNRVSSLIEQANRENTSVVISIHNHPGDNIFSINDLYIFTENPCIKIMMITNTKGELSFLFRPDHLNLKGTVTQNMEDTAPDISDRIKNWKTANPDIEYELTDILTIDERKAIVRGTIDFMERNGVDYCEYSDQEKINQYIFRDSAGQQEQSELNNALKKADKHPFEGVLYEEYEENEEDGHEI